MTIKYKTYNTEIGNGRQSVEYTETLKASLLDLTTKLQIRIKSDSHDFQSYARIFRFDGEQWQPIDALHYSTMKTPTKLAYGRSDSQALLGYFKSDRDTLLKQATDILFD